METFGEVEIEPKRKRPVFLTVLCILTFISTGLSMLGLVFSLLAGPMSDDEVETIMAKGMVQVNELRDQGMTYMADQMEKINNIQSYTNQSHYLVLGVNFCAIVLGFAGALLMWKGNKLGFHSYILYNIVSILSMYVAVPVNEVPTLVIILGVIFSSIFIFMYSRNLKWLN